MRIAIHDSGTGSFSERWIDYCKHKSIPFKIVDCYKTNIVEQLSDCDCLMWHHNHILPKDVIISRQILNAFEASGKRVFPDFRTAWHFDDKLGQKYLFESIGAPLVPTYTFFSKKDALVWALDAKFPKVLKLRSGGGSKNVWLVKDIFSARRLIYRAFGKGFRQYNARLGTFEEWRKYKLGIVPIKEVIKAMAHLFYPTKLETIKPREKGYVLFQDYVTGNNFDIRVVVINGKAFAIKRRVRENDFRASGSGEIMYSKNEIDLECVKLAFELNTKLKSQCLGFDFLHGSNNEPKVIEISYGFTAKGYDSCPGYWNEKLEWHEGPFNPYGWMVDNLIKEL